MTDNNLPTKNYYPKLDFRDSAWWLTAFGFGGGILGGALYLFTDINSYSLLGKILVFILCVVLTPIVIFFSIYAIKTVKTDCKRIFDYDLLYSLVEQKNNELIQTKELISHLSQQLTIKQIIEIDRMFLKKKVSFVVIKKSRKITLDEGNQLFLIDKSNWSIIGKFEVIETRNNEYYAKQIEVDPLWLGYYIQTNQTEFSAPPFSAAILVPNNGENNE